MSDRSGLRAISEPRHAPIGHDVHSSIATTRTTWIVIAAALAVFVGAFAMDWRLPGLYMDAVNPEYIIPGIFDHTAPGNHPWILPGNLILSRFPLFAATLYHGTTQLYFALPLMALFGVDVGTLRIAQGAAGFLILLLISIYASRSSKATSAAVAASAMIPLALDPSFVVALRTQAYSCLFPLTLLLGSLLLARDAPSRVPRALRLFASGALYGLAVFSYFIFAFFFPALIWMLARDRGPGKSSLFRTIPFWLFGALFGYAPIFAGLFRVTQALGGFDTMIRWLHRHSDSLHPLGDDIGAANRVLNTLTVARGVFTGRWPWLTVLQHHAGDFTGSLKAGLLFAVPLLVLVAKRKAAGERRAIVLPLVFIASFLACATIFGGRLDGHHFTTLVPLLYAAFGAACAALWTAPQEPAARTTTATASSTTAIVLLVGVAAINAINLAHYHRDLEASGGVGLYSDAIDHFSRDVVKQDPDATAYFPDWGYVMPFVFVTRARVAQLDSVDPLRIARESCAGKPQIVVFTGGDNAAKFNAVTALANQPPPAITTWSQRDGAPVFQSARYAARTDCDAHDDASTPAMAPAHGSAPWITVTPDASSDCAFLSPRIAQVRWDAGDPSLQRAEVWITPPGSKSKLWAGGPQSSETSTEQWAVPGMAFALVDPTTQRTLAQTEIRRIACP